MKCTVIIDPEREEEVIVYAHQKSGFAETVESLARQKSEEIIGYDGRSVVMSSLSDVFAFTVEENKVFAVTEKEKLKLSERLYKIEEKLDKRFIKINQSCIVNVCKIERFDTTIGASLLVILKNGYRDYVSRRQLKAVKERIGLK